MCQGRRKCNENGTTVLANTSCALARQHQRTQWHERFTDCSTFIRFFGFDTSPILTLQAHAQVDGLRVSQTTASFLGRFRRWQLQDPIQIRLPLTVTLHCRRAKHETPDDLIWRGDSFRLKLQLQRRDPGHITAVYCWRMVGSAACYFSQFTASILDAYTPPPKWRKKTSNASPPSVLRHTRPTA